MHLRLQVLGLCIFLTYTSAWANVSHTVPALPELIPEHQLLALDEEIKNLLNRQVKSLPTRKQRLQKLIEVLYLPYYYNIRYNESGTKTAVDTFYSGGGNCISLANLFIAAARHVGLRARYQSVTLAPEWRPREGFYEVPGHINVVVDIHRERAIIEFNQSYLDGFEPRRMVKKIISDKQAAAEFYNNLAVENLSQKNHEHALAYFKKSIDTYKKLDFVWSNMGVAYKQMGEYQLAEQSYLKALDLNPYNDSTISNIYILYKELGNNSQSDIYAKKAESYARKNPYHLEKLASAHIEQAQYQAAIGLLKKAIRIFDLEPNFYHSLAIAYYYEKDFARSKQAFEKAKSLADSQEYKERYQRKINAIATVH